MTALNLMKLEDRLQSSMSNAMLFQLLVGIYETLILICLNASWLDFDFKTIKYKKGFDTLCNYGVSSL